MVWERSPDRIAMSMYPSKAWSGVWALVLAVISFLMGPASSGPLLDDLGIVEHGLIVTVAARLALGAAALLVAVVAVMHLRDVWTGRPLLVVDERGITDKAFGVRFLAWSEISRIPSCRRGEIGVAVRGDSPLLRCRPLLFAPRHERVPPVNCYYRFSQQVWGAVMNIPTVRLPLPTHQTLHEIAAIAPGHVVVIGETARALGARQR